MPMQYFGYNAEELGFQDGQIARQNHYKFSDKFTKLKKRQKAKGNIFIKYKEKYLCCKEKCKAKVKRNTYHWAKQISQKQVALYKINMNNSKYR